MQNTSRAHSFRFSMMMLALLVATCIASLALVPNTASAKEYTMPHVDIQMDVSNAGNIHFVEDRQFSFDGNFTCVWWTLGELPENASVEVNGVALRQGDSSEVAGQ